MSGTHPSRRAYWLKTLHEWHWISSAVALVGLLLFSVTGITLNHVSWFNSEPQVVNQAAQLPDDLRVQLLELSAQHETTQVAPQLPQALRDWSIKALDVNVERSEADWSPQELYLSMQRPGGDATVSLDLETGEVEHRDSDRGWIAYFNDLHKGRHTGLAWSWFIDIIAVACLLFAITGLLILKMHAASRPSTWPLVAFGCLLPFLIAVLFIH